MLPFVPDIVPTILVALVIVGAFVLACAPILRRGSFYFYAAFIALSALTFVVNSDNLPVVNVVVQVCASCYTGIAFYLWVMFAGALPRRWWLTKRLLSVRSEMSIIGGFIMVAHVIKVAMMVPLSYLSIWPLMMKDAATPMWLACGVVGPLLVICFLVPWITSFKFIRNRMSFKKWKKTQRLAYPFMLLMILQGILLGLGHATYAGAGTASYTAYLVNAVTYAGIGIVYLAFKIPLAVQTRRMRKANKDEHSA